MSGPTSIRSLQIASIKRMLQSVDGWKVLILDQASSDSLSPLLSINQLHQLNVTLHLRIENKREAVRDTAAIYFITANEANIDHVLSDMARSLYHSYHLHFTGSINRHLLEKLASSAATAGLAQKVSKIYDEYCDFVCLEEDLISFHSKQSFQSINSTTTSDQTIKQFIDSQCDSLFSMIVTMGVIPIIRASPNAAAELIAQQLDERLRSHLAQRANLFVNQSMSSAVFHRPLLILVDRTQDLTAPLYHPWTYQAALNDLLHLSNNRVTLTETPDQPSNQQSNPSAKPKTRTYDLHSADDSFWRANAGSPFEEVATNVTAKLNALQADQNRITQSTSRSFGETDATTATSDLSSAINALPKIQKRKKQLESHTNIATALMHSIKSRNIKEFSDTERAFISRMSTDRKELDALLTNSGWMRDKLRAALIFCLTQEQITDEQISDLRGLLASQIPSQEPNSPGSINVADLTAFEFIKQYRLISRLGQQTSGTRHTAVQPATLEGAGWMFRSLAHATEVVSRVGELAQNVRQQLTGDSIGFLPLTKLVDDLVQRREPNNELFKFHDPRAAKANSTHKRIGSAAPSQQQAFRDVIVCTVGGGCYAEYQNLRDFAKQSSSTPNPIHFIYATTEVNSPEQFLQQIVKIGTEISAQRTNNAVD